MAIGRGYLALGAVVVLAAGWMLSSGDHHAAQEISLANLVAPTLSPDQEAGRALFDAQCAVCHGPSATGSDQGPPLVHRIYEPSHHGDLTFLLAARQGVRAHHWRFGDMPAVDTVSEEEVMLITDYIRALQRANGIK